MYKELEKYYPVDTPNKALFNRIYATIPTEIQSEKNIILLIFSMLSIGFSLFFPAYAVADIVTDVNLEDMMTLLEYGINAE